MPLTMLRFAATDHLTSGLMEQHRGELVRLQQPAKFEHRGGIGRFFQSQINSDKAADRCAIADRVFQPFIGQAIPLLHKVQTQHALQANRRNG